MREEKRGEEEGERGRERARGERGREGGALVPFRPRHLTSLAFPQPALSVDMEQMLVRIYGSVGGGGGGAC